MSNENPAIKADEKIDDAQVLKGVKIPFIPEEGHVLVKLMPVEKVEKEMTVLDDDSNEGKEKGEDGDVMDVKTEIKEVEAEVRKAVVLRISPNERNKPAFKEGDTVVIKTKVNGITLDIFKEDSMLIKRFEILGTWND